MATRITIRGEFVYRNLEAKMRRCAIKRNELAKILAVSPKTVTNKLRGKTQLTLKEMLTIKRILSQEKMLTPDYLFAEDDSLTNTRDPVARSATSISQNAREVKTKNKEDRA